MLSGAALAAAVVLAGCQSQNPPPAPASSVSPTLAPRDFTVVTTEKLTTADPAAVNNDLSATIAFSLFQRLMTVQPDKALLKPDAADCLFVSAQLYQCTLRENLRFVNGHELTSSDVRFSIQRALRIDAPGTSTSLLNALDHIETPDKLTLKFYLKWADTQFGYALATPAASIVDEAVYDPDQLQALGSGPIGSGPFLMRTMDDNHIVLDRSSSYSGPSGAGLPTVVIRRVADSAAVEEAMTKQTAEVAWRGLNHAAVVRLQQQIAASAEQRTDSGWSQVPMPGRRVWRLVWNSASAHRLNVTLRNALSLSLQPDRTLDSVIPRDVEGHIKAFAVGGRPTVPKITGQRIKLTLSYSSLSPDALDLASVVRARIEAKAPISVQLVTDSGNADLTLTDALAWMNTPAAWLQEYVDHPLPGSAAKLSLLSNRARSATSDAVRDVALAEIQKQAAADATVLPISQDDGVLFLGAGVTLADPGFGPGWQLAPWALRK